MAFMEREITQCDYYKIETSHGTVFLPADVVGTVTEPEELRDYCEGDVEGWELIEDGWLCRLSAPGYMDCTEWTPCDSEQECIEYLDETYPDDESEDDE